MPKPEKEKIVSELKEKIDSANSILLTDFTGLNVEEISELRDQLRDSSIEYRIVKNTLTRISVEELGMNQILNYLDGPTAIAFGLDNPLSPAKIISEYAKKNKKPTVKAFFLDGQIYESSQVAEIAKTPDKKVLQSQLLGTISAPLSNFALSVGNLLQQLVFVLNAIKEKKEQQ